MKKLLIVALILILASFAFIACSDNEPSPPPVIVAPEPEPEPVVEEEPDPEPTVDPEEEFEEEPEEELEEEYDGIGILIERGPVVGAVVVIGEDQDTWPHATGTEGGIRAFEPEPGVTYRISFGVTNFGTGGWRVRWTRDVNLFGENTAGDDAIVNDYPLSPAEVATVIPAHFNQDVSPDGDYTLVIDITLDGAQGFDELIGNIGLTGTAGSHDFSVRYVTVERLEGGPGTDVAELLISTP
ncbi:MAG: hypothetical protein FWF77_08640 [Defluviitaleaceae bacterium]|nr:hypothetical protein [Defluviitaleaceae bacterium]